MLIQLFTNAFGNYIVFKLYEVGDQDDVDVVGAAVLSDSICLSEDTYSCRVVQKCHMLEEYKSTKHALNNHNQPISRIILFASFVAYAFEIQVRHGQQSGACDRNKDNEESRLPSFLINQNIEQFVLTQVDKRLHQLLSKTDPSAPSLLRSALFGRYCLKEQ
ncbi:MAG: hypothetical protein EZS28_007388 [Streblomastix strix]|uniref:PUM-HD domain-containing protein n=1 Tax=Streblomastix strix TaxID=222440 RepID=A0A5J4WPM6_9EUKA|nr:MAG: hypothetical protein EZS28_007388 [Streblomastix strix]